MASEDGPKFTDTNAAGAADGSEIPSVPDTSVEAPGVANPISSDRSTDEPTESAESHGAPRGSALPHTLEQRLAGDDFARRGWQRLLDLADYFAHLVDGRTTGVLATESRETYLRVLGVATGLKATLQWFALDRSVRPKFIVEAERYLVDGPQAEWIGPPPNSVPEDERLQIRSGPVVARKGGRGTAGRLHALGELKQELIEILRPLTQKDLLEHLAAFRSPKRQKTHQGWLLPRALGDQILVAFIRGTCADLLREQGFEWSWDEDRDKLERAINELLMDSNIEFEPPATREGRLEDLAEGAIRVALTALGVRVEKDLFRERRER